MADIDRNALAALIEARDVLRAWADVEIISNTCIPEENRHPGCLSCDTLHFFEALDDAIAAEGGE